MRPSPKFALRTLFIATTAIAILFAWAGLRVRQLLRQSQAVHHLQETANLRATFVFEPAWPQCVWRPLLGPASEWVVKAYISGFDPNTNVVFGPSAKQMEWLGCLPRIRGLYVGGKGVDDETIRYISREMPDLEELGLANVNISDLGVEQIAAMTSLRILSIVNNDKFAVAPVRFDARAQLTDRSAVFIARMANLDTLAIVEVGIKDSGLQSIGKMEKLIGLSVKGLDISENGVRGLSGLVKLKTLDFDAVPGVNDASLSQLASMTDLRRLDLDGTNVTSEGLCDLAAKLPNLLDENGNWRGSLSETLTEEFSHAVRLRNQ